VLTWDSERMDYLTNLVDRMEFHDLLRPFL
jgi:hypothetical protein